MKTTEEIRLEISNLVQEFADLKYAKKTHSKRSIRQVQESSWG